MKIISIRSIKYSTECTVDPATQHETCRQVEIDENKQFESKTDLSSILVEDGGLLVEEKSDCADEIATCKEIIDDENSELCQPEYRLREKCKRTCQLCSKKTTTIGVAQTKGGNQEEIDGVGEVIAEMVRYLQEEVLSDSSYRNVYKDCVNKNRLCAFWAYIGECPKNPDYMVSNCILACKKCSEHPRFAIQ